MIADHEKEEDEINTLVDDWIFFALVIDRILLVFFGIVCLLGSFGLFYRYANYYFSRAGYQQRAWTTDVTWCYLR